MENKEAIEKIQNLRENLILKDSVIDKALVLAISALEQREKPKEGMSASAYDPNILVKSIESFLLDRYSYIKSKNVKFEILDFTFDDLCFLIKDYAMHEYHSQFLSVKVSDEDIEKAFPCELGQVVIPDEGLTYEQMLLSNYHRRKGAKWMRSRMSNTNQ